jgi:hypothetical protein
MQHIQQMAIPADKTPSGAATGSGSAVPTVASRHKRSLSLTGTRRRSGPVDNGHGGVESDAPTSIGPPPKIQHCDPAEAIVPATASVVAHAAPTTPGNVATASATTVGSVASTPSQMPPARSNFRAPRLPAALSGAALSSTSAVTTGFSNTWPPSARTKFTAPRTQPALLAAAVAGLPQAQVAPPVARAPTPVSPRAPLVIDEGRDPWLAQGFIRPGAANRFRAPTRPDTVAIPGVSTAATTRLALVGAPVPLGWTGADASALAAPPLPPQPASSRLGGFATLGRAGPAPIMVTAVPSPTAAPPPKVIPPTYVSSSHKPFQVPRPTTPK